MSISDILLTQQFIIVCFLYTSFAQLHVVDIPNQGKIQGVELSKVRIQKIIAYYGIPYAQPPEGNLRFAPPKTNPLPSWNITKRNTEYPPSCLQVKQDYKASELPFLSLLTDVELPSNISEDCLYLNVFVPNATPPPQGFATIVWIHPGNFTTGMPSIWNPHTVVYRQRIIVVTFAWRLNIMGFFSSTDSEAPGNYGLMDQQAAMRWVKNNIKHFGGNPDNICAMGYGTGATSIGIHMINSESRDLFNRAIMMSSSLFEPSAYRFPDEDIPLIDKLVQVFGCDRKPTVQLMKCLRKADAIQLVEETSNINWRPLIDKDLNNSTSDFLPEHPKNYFENGEYAKIPILTGYTNMEQALEIVEWDNSTVLSQDSLRQMLMERISGDLSNVNNTESGCSNNADLIVDSVMFFYAPATTNYTADTFRRIVTNFLVEKTYAASTIQMANYLSKDQPVYVYRFDMKPSSKVANKDIPEWIKVPHLFDLTYVWGLPYWKPDQQEWDPRDKRIADTVMSFWTSFAKTSDPTQNTIYAIQWDAYTKEKPGLLIMDNNIYMSDPKTVNYKAFEFWNDYYPKVYQMVSYCCGLSDSRISIPFELFLYFIIAFKVLYTF